jgi:spoIIIJ-associated protein
LKKEAIATGATIDEARRNAILELGLDIDQVEIDLITEVIDEPEKKVLGLFGGKPAKVKVYYEISRSPAAAAGEYLRSILNGLGAESVNFTVEEHAEYATFTLEGEGLGVVIGRRGDTLDSIQYLVSLVANRVNSSYFKISINTGDYREKRENTIESLAKRTAEKAIRLGKNLALEPMNPYERRIMHTTVQEIEGASSWSVGSESDRHVVIGPAGLNEGAEGESVIVFNRNRNGGRSGGRDFNRDRGGRDGRRDGGRGRYDDRRGGGRDFNRGGRNDNRRSSSNERPGNRGNIGNISDVERQPAKSDVSAPLYGKIEIKKSSEE